MRGNCLLLLLIQVITLGGCFAHLGKTCALPHPHRLVALFGIIACGGPHAAILELLCVTQRAISKMI